MGQALLPFLEYVVLQLIVVIVGLNTVHEKELDASGVLKSWIFGQILLFAILQILAVPMILLRWNFSVLFWSYVAVSAIMFGFGCWRLLNGRTKIRIRIPDLRPVELFLLMVAVLLILWQACSYFFGIHLDEDDARFVTQANDALEYGHMLINHYETGELIGRFDPIRDVTSPWVMILAITSRILFTKPAIFTHTIYSTLEIILVYGIYWLNGQELFKKKKSQLSFILLVVVINLFFTVTVYTQSTFALTRIWQGKASVAAVIVPMFFYLFVCVNKSTEEHPDYWIMIIATGCAACLMSGVGITLSLVAISLLGIYSILVYKKWKRIPLWLASLVMPLSYGLLYMFLKR